MKLRLFKILEYMKHLPRLRDKIKIIVAFLIVVGVPIKYEKTRNILRMLFSVWIKHGEMVVDNCIYKLVDLDSAYIVNPAYEDELKDYLNPERGETLIDVGAHIGKYTIYFAKKGVKVIAVEPSPDFFNVLQKNVQINGLESNIKALNVAASDKEVMIYMNRNMFIFPKTINIPYQAKSIPLDKEVNNEHIDWVKIDVDGEELNVLKGLKGVLSSQSPKIIIELRPRTKNDVLSFLKDFNYENKLIFEYGIVGGEQLYYYSEKSNDK